MFIKSVAAKVAQLESVSAVGHEPEQAGSRTGAGDLSDPVRDEPEEGEPPANRQSQRNGRIEMSAGNVAKGVDHGKHGEPHRERHAEVADPQVEIGVDRVIHEDGRHDGGANPGEDQKKRTHELRDHLPDEQHSFPS